MIVVDEDGQVHWPLDLFGEAVGRAPDAEAVIAALRTADPDGRRFAAVFRSVFDQLYDGGRTGRYRWDQLFKTEKTHCGTLVEIAIRREFTDVIGDGRVLDFAIAGADVDCKFSQDEAKWMVPPECVGKIVLGCWASDAESSWSVGIVKAEEDLLARAHNRDGKLRLSEAGKNAICWLWRHEPMAPNVLLHLNPALAERIMGHPTGQARVNELFRAVTCRPIPRATVVTVAQEADPMKRVRYNGGARSHLAPEGYLIAGDSRAHRAVARGLGVPEPGNGEFVSVRVVPADGEGPGAVSLRDVHGTLGWWRAATPGDPVTEPAPVMPDTGRVL